MADLGDLLSQCGVLNNKGDKKNKKKNKLNEISSTIFPNSYHIYSCISWLRAYIVRPLHVLA